MQSISYMELIIFILASFRLTHLLVFDEIALFIRKPFVEVTIEKDEETGKSFHNSKARGTGLRKFIGSILICYWCTSVWSSAFIVLATWLLPAIFPLFVILAVSGAAAAIETKLYDE